MGEVIRVDFGKNRKGGQEGLAGEMRGQAADFGHRLVEAGVAFADFMDILNRVNQIGMQQSLSAENRALYAEQYASDGKTLQELWADVMSVEEFAMSRPQEFLYVFEVFYKKLNQK